MDEKIKQNMVERFIRYVKIDTQSDDTSTTTPSTKKQFDLARILEKELKAIGLQDVQLTGKCYLTARLPSNTDKKVPVIGLIAHMDTSPEMTGKDVKPQIIEKYNGKSIVLNTEKDIVLDTRLFPEIKKYKGLTLITTDGTTLLGADNKAGVAEIISAMEYLLGNPDIKHGEIRLGFTPDEEIGRGADHFDVIAFGADFAYTIDSGEIGSLEYETFNAASAVVTVNGKNVHPGYAKGKMINAQQVAIEFNSLLPYNERPEFTSGYDGFYHLIKLEGNVEQACLHYIVRDHDRKKFEDKKKIMQHIADYIHAKYGRQMVVLEIKDQYYNMREKIEADMWVVDLAKKAYLEAGITPNIHPIRGGTDGARLSYMGLLTPNIFTGAHNFHSRYEYVPVESMIKAVEVIVNICRLNNA
jgi:tripeptide aminopeptidase